MVRFVKGEGECVLGGRLEDVLQILFIEDAFYYEFHKKRNDFDVEIGQWTNAEQTRIRTVNFKTVKNDLPRILERIVGKSIAVCSVEERMQQESKDRITIHSCLRVSGVPLADGLRNEGTIVLSRIDNLHTMVTVEYEIEFKTSVWGITGVVERLMVSEAKSSMEMWKVLAEVHFTQRIKDLKSKEGEKMGFEEEEAFFDVLSDGEAVNTSLLELKDAVWRVEDAVKSLSVRRKSASGASARKIFVYSFISGLLIVGPVLSLI